MAGRPSFLASNRNDSSSLEHRAHAKNTTPRPSDTAAIFHRAWQARALDQDIFFEDTARAHVSKSWRRLCHSIVGRQSIRPARRTGAAKPIVRYYIESNARSARSSGDGWPKYAGAHV